MAIYTFLFLILQALLLEASAIGPVRSKRYNEMPTDIYPVAYRTTTENPVVAYNPCLNNPCEHICMVQNRLFRCRCRFGYILERDGKSCREATPIGPVRGQTLNQMGTDIYPVTYRTTTENPVVAYNPCRNNPCQHICMVQNELFRCRCRIGYILDTDGKSCREAPLPSSLLKCSINNGGCEHTCVMIMNNVRCYCPPGYKLLADGMRCARNTQAPFPSPVLNCNINNGGCEQTCRMRNNMVRCYCFRGYKLLADGKHCTLDTPTLQYTCRVPDIQDGDYGIYVYENFEIVTKADFVRNKEVLTLRCHKGYAPFPRQNNDSREGFFEGEIKCEDGIWSKNLSCHSSSCSYVPRIKSDSTINNEHQKRNHGEVITYAFWDDSTLIEKGKVKCHFGEWIGISTKFMDESITCSEFETSSGVEVSYTEGVSVGSYALFSCSSQNILEGESYAICLNNGTWSHSLPRCKESVTCKEFTSFPGLQISYSKGGSVGSRVSFSCLPPNVLNGNSYAICLSNGTWSHSSPSCTGPVTCSEFQTSPGLQVSYSRGVAVGSKATFRCSPPGALYGKSYAICLVNGSWSSLPQCGGSNTCSEFETLQGLEVKYTNNLSVGSNASFSCTPPSTLVGHSYAICQNNGTWSHPLPSCEGVNGCYLKQPESSTLLIDPKKENYSFGDMINVGCPPGHKLTRDVERLMCLGKQWSDALPDCKELF